MNILLVTGAVKFEVQIIKIMGKLDINGIFATISSINAKETRNISSGPNFLCYATQ